MTIKESDDVFRDLLQTPDHAKMKAKHDAAAHIRRHMLKGEYSQERFAKICGLTPTELSKIASFKLRDFPIERLTSVLARLQGD
jgi:predicted XRE-type DNA-binding protein